MGSEKGTFLLFPLNLTLTACISSKPSFGISLTKVCGLSLVPRLLQNPGSGSSGNPALRRHSEQLCCSPALLFAFNFQARSCPVSRPLGHEQALWFLHTKGPGFRGTGASLPTSLLSFPPTHLCSSPACKELPPLQVGGRISETCPELAGPVLSIWRKCCIFHLSPRKIWFSASLFVALRVPKGRRIGSWGGGAHGPSQGPEGQPPAPEAELPGEGGTGAACNGPAAGENEGGEFQLHVES